MAWSSGEGPMPMVFFGHGSPTVAIEDTEVTRAWRTMAETLGRPEAILAISAHWTTRGTAVTAMERPKTIHDFGAFPQALFDIRYPAPGRPALAARIAELLAPDPVMLDQGHWGLDHGTWTVLTKAYPDADIPVVQLSLDVGLTPAERFQIGRRLGPLRDEGVLIMGTGNVVHNLGVMDWDGRHADPYPWAERFHAHVRGAIEGDAPAGLVDFLAQGEDAVLSLPSAEHYWPLLYVMGARRPTDRVRIGPDHIEYRSVSMLSAILDSRADRVAA